MPRCIVHLVHSASPYRPDATEPGSVQAFDASLPMIYGNRKLRRKNMLSEGKEFGWGFFDVFGLIPSSIGGRDGILEGNWKFN